MGRFYISIAVSCAVFILTWAWKILNYVWFKPKRLEKCLRKQGFHGNSYRLLLGDLTEMNTMSEEAKSTPMDFSHDIVPRVMPFLDKTIKNYGENVITWLGSEPALLIMDRDLTKEILAKNYVFQKPPATPVIKLLAEGVALYETDKWAKHRRIVNPAFHLEKLKHMLPAFYSASCEMLSKWEEIASEAGSCELDVSPYLHTLTADAISRTAFGSNYEEGRRIFELQNEQADLFLQSQKTSYIPGWRFLPTKSNKRMKEIAKEVRSLVLGVMNKRIKAMEEGKACNEDLLSLLVESNRQEVQQHGNKNSGMTIDEVVQECKLFYIGGQATSSALLVWTMILLGKHTDWQDRAHEEVLRVFGSKKPDFEELNRLKIVTMILYEVLRLYPPAIMLGRMTKKDTNLGNLRLPAGVHLLLPAILLHQDPEIWGNDAKEFNPKRFSEGISRATKGQFSYLPFGAGPRICVGQNFAMLEAKMAMATILQRFSFELSPSYLHSPCNLLHLQPQHGAQLILHKL